MNKGFEDQKVKDRMKNIRHKVVVLSGKGGVGKSTVAVNIAMALAGASRKVGLLDIDVHGPSVPKLLGVEGLPLRGTEDSIYPFAIGDNLRIMSIGFLLRSSDDAVIWRGPMKFNVIKQFLGDVEWGELDYLIVDSPPGTGDEPLSVLQLIGDADGAVIVTTPQKLAILDVRKCINFCHQLKVPIIGVVENMSGFICPKCGERTDIFKSGGGEEMARDMNVPFLGRVPVDPGIVAASDDGKPYLVNFKTTEAAKIFAEIAAPVLGLYDAEKKNARTSETETAPAATSPARKEEDGDMKIAIPVVQGRLSMHFGHCDEFVIVDVDPVKREILGSETVDAPPHEPGLLPVWLKELGADLIITGGMGSRAQMLFKEKGIDVMVGASSDEPEAIVKAYLDGTLATGTNICDH